ncbi:AAA family ATPase [Pseudonocardia sp. TRM90224]|uniref:AAA family ATPase n=1 Tax=Pseudonocardia sp. TRM90224 TaxID=2812678 RepID=UPI001E2C0024|nr:AAA family ATPase [Pseudonocardia sp. TRM90224]
MADVRGAGAFGVGSGPSLLCTELVGRRVEVAALRERVTAATRSAGGLAVLVGEAGAGKSRLAAEVADAARAAGAAVLIGRAVPGRNPVPYRPVAEAMLAAFRAAPVPDAPELAGFHGHLGRIVPAWRGAAGVEESPVLLSEAVVRLLAVLGRGSGCVLVLEDLHWADPETLDAVDYMADALPTTPVLCVCTTRPEGAAAGLVDRLARRDPGSVLPVEPLLPEDVDHMVAACLQVSAAPPDVREFVGAHAEGSPFLVEELLAGLVSSGALAFTGGCWNRGGELTPTVPSGLQDSIRQRAAALDPTSRQVVDAAAVLGRRFDWQLLPGVADVDGRAVVDGLRAAVAAQLVEVEDGDFLFRHALTREALLADLLPPDRLDLARRAWQVIERAYPELPGGLCELAAELAETAGAPAEAAGHLVESARRALDQGALGTAEATARRAQRLAPDGCDADLDAAELLVRVLVAAGKPAVASALGQDVVARTDIDSHRRADLLVVLARAAVQGGDTGRAAEHVGAARSALDGSLATAAGARIDAVAAHVELENGRLAEAEALAGAAVAAARSTGQPDVECEALEVLGRVASVAGPDAAAPWQEKAAEVAERAGLTTWHLRVRQQLAIAAWARGDVSQLRTTRELAQQYGAMVTVAVMDLSLADLALSNFDRDGCRAAAQACVDASRRYGLATESVAHLWLAGAHALAGDEAAMRASADAALARDPSDARILADLYGRVLATYEIVTGDLEALLVYLDIGMEHVRVAPPLRSVYPGRALWVIAHTIDDDDLGAAARAEFDASARGLGLLMFAHTEHVVDAIVRGRQGDAEGAAASLAAADALMPVGPWGTGLMRGVRMLVAGAATRDGWGDPVRWLRECEAFFTAGGFDGAARRCRTMLGAAGAPVPMLFHLGPRRMFPAVAAAVERIVPAERLRWLSFGHVESDECGSMNAWLSAAPGAAVAFNTLGCMLSLDDLADRPPRRTSEDDVHDIGGHRIRTLMTPHLPHGWEAQVVFDETTRTLFCGDLFTRTGDTPAIVHHDDPVGPAIAAEDLFGYTAVTAATAPTLRRLADLQPRTLALMHGPAFAGDCVAALHGLGDAYEARFSAACAVRS